MPFKYIAYTADNQMVQGILDAFTDKSAEETLDKAGYRVISLKEVKRPPNIEDLFPSHFQVKGQDVITFSRQLATLLEAGLAILPALQVLEDQISSKPFKRIITEVVKDLQAGSSFSRAIARHPHVFPEMFRRMMGIGERTAAMTSMIEPMMTIGIAMIVGFIALSVIMPMYSIVGAFGPPQPGIQSGNTGSQVFQVTANPTLGIYYNNALVAAVPQNIGAPILEVYTSPTDPLDAFAVRYVIVSQVEGATIRVYVDRTGAGVTVAAWIED